MTDRATILLFLIWALSLSLTGCRKESLPRRAGEMILSGADTELAQLLHSNPDLVSYQSENGWTPLHFACSKGRPACARVLLDCGADVNARIDSGRTPLMLAAGAAEHSAELVELLLDRGAQADSVSLDGKTALHAAALSGGPSVAEELLAAGCPLDARDLEGYTPLQIAVVFRNVPMAEFLLAAGANPNNKTSDLGLTPLSGAVSSGSPQLVRLLFSYGARPGNEGQPILGRTGEPAFWELVRLLREEREQSTRSTDSPHPEATSEEGGAEEGE
jgi:ankyrin repeat protein